MAVFNNHRFSSLLVCMAIVAFSSPAFGGMYFSTAIYIKKSIYFQKPDGEPVQLQRGVYEVEEEGKTTIMVSAIGTEQSMPIALQAIPAGHEEELATASADLVPSPDNNPDKRHILLLMPNGLSLEAVGSYSGVFTRSASTWSSKVLDKEVDASEEPLTLEIAEAMYFKTVGGEPQVVQAGSYEVSKTDQGLVLTPSRETTGEVIHIEKESMGTSAAVLLPEFNDNPDLALLMLATVEGQSFIAVGSQDGTFPRGWGKRLRKKARAAYGKTRENVKRKAKIVSGKVKRYVPKRVVKGAKVVSGKARRYVPKPVKKGAKLFYKVQKRLHLEPHRYCTSKVKRAKNCVEMFLEGYTQGNYVGSPAEKGVSKAFKGLENSGVIAK